MSLDGTRRGFCLESCLLSDRLARCEENRVGEKSNARGTLVRDFGILTEFSASEGSRIRRGVGFTISNITKGPPSPLSAIG